MKVIIKQSQVCPLNITI